MNSLPLLRELGENIALLIALAFIYSLLAPRFQRMTLAAQNFVRGIVFGLFSILSISMATPVSPGLLIDGRGIMISIAGYTGGAVAGLVAAAIAVMFRLLLGGQGAVLAVPNAFIYAGIGVLVGWYERRQALRLGGVWFLIIGMLNALNLFLTVLVLSDPVRSAVLEQIILPITVLFPFATWMLGVLLQNQQRQNEAVAALMVERSRLRTLIDHIPDYIFIKDKNGGFIVSNSAHTRAARARSDGALRGKTASSFFPSELAAQFNEDDQSVLQGNAILAQERRTLDADGHAIWVVTTKVPLRDRTGDVVGLVGISHDVTKRKLAEEALQMSERKYRQIIETAAEGIWMVDEDGYTTFVNPRMASMLGWQVDEMQGKSLLDFVGEQDKAEASAHLERRRQGISEEYDFRFIRKDGSVIWAIVSTTAVLDENDQYVGALKMITDITDRKRAEAQELELAAERQRVQILKRFITDISHDFRTPLTILQTSVSLLGRNASEQQERRLNIMDSQIHRLTKLLDSMLDIYSLEDDQQMYMRSDDINGIVSRAVDHFRADAEGKNQTLELNLAEDIPMTMLNPQAIERAITQLIDNALNFTPQNGTIVVCTCVEAQEIVVRVRDTGVGIAPNALDHVFEHFYRADPSRSTQTGGSGLGLTIVRKIVEGHGGNVTVESVVGEGTTFSIILPIVLSDGKGTSASTIKPSDNDHQE